MSSPQIQERPGADANSMQWILGHIIASRYSILQLMGSDSNQPYGPLFSKNAEPKEPGEYPSVEELKESWNQAAKELNDRLEELTEGELEKPIERKFPGVDSTVMGGITFLHFHESYHIGQLAYIRRLHHQTQLVG